MRLASSVQACRFEPVAGCRSPVAGSESDTMAKAGSAVQIYERDSVFVHKPDRSRWRSLPPLHSNCPGPVASMSGDPTHVHRSSPVRTNGLCYQCHRLAVCPNLNRGGWRGKTRLILHSWPVIMSEEDRGPFAPLRRPDPNRAWQTGPEPTRAPGRSEHQTSIRFDTRTHRSGSCYLQLPSQPSQPMGQAKGSEGFSGVRI